MTDSQSSERPRLGQRDFLGTLATHVEGREWTSGLDDEDVVEVTELNQTLQTIYNSVLSSSPQMGEAMHALVVLVAAQEIKIRRLTNIIDDQREWIEWAGGVFRGMDKRIAEVARRTP